MSRPILLAVVGPTATGKSALGIALAERYGGEIVSCDSTAVYRGFDIGTDKVPSAERRGVPHHMMDLVAPSEAYSAARYGREAAVCVRAIAERGRRPMLVGGTGLYFRALVRGMFPGPGRDEALRRRLTASAERHGVEWLHRMVGRVDPESARRIQPRDLKRLVRALEVYFLTGRSLSAHFDATESAIPEYDVVTIGLSLPPADIAERVARRVDAQFDRGIVDEVRGLLASGVPADAHPFSGLVYREVLELLQGARDERATRELIVRENRRYARRQLIWFRKEPNVTWVRGAGERAETFDEVSRLIAAPLGLTS